jgi:hypothetical protein
MRRLSLVVAFAFLLFSVSNAIVSSILESRRPEATLSRTDVDVGLVRVGSATSFDVALTNTGSGDLFVRKVANSCECAGTTLTSRRISTDHPATITVYFRPKVVGNAKAYTAVETNDPVHPVLIITLSARVESGRDIED